MGRMDCLIDPVRKKRFEIQGYHEFSDSELYGFRLGLRFAYFLCGLLVLLGLILNNPEVLIFALLVAFFGAILLRHPFDYLYNYVVRKLLKKPAIPPRPNQGRFACGIATVWVGILIYLMLSGIVIWTYVAGGILVFIAALVSILDICIPSIIYNFLFGIKSKPVH